MLDKKAVVLLSGGLDSATAMAVAISQKYKVYAMSFRYGQRHSYELECAKNLSQTMGVIDHIIVDINLRQFGGSSLTDNINVPKGRDMVELSKGIPITYVPARNTIFLSFALAWSEVLGANDVFIGVNALDYSGYPDCRPEYIDSFQEMANLATKAGVEGNSKLIIHAPLIHMTKAEIIELGQKLNVDYSLTSSCYDPNELGQPCGSCDSCQLRIKGFKEAGLVDPLVMKSLD